MEGILSEPRGNASSVIERSSISQKITFRGHVFSTPIKKGEV